jgi:hypothetical protein
MARARIGLGQPDLAIPLCERAVDAFHAGERSGIGCHFLGDTLFTHAQAPWDVGRDRPRALDLARQARPYLRQRIDLRDRAVELDAWLAARGERPSG